MILSVDDKGRSELAWLKIILEEEMEVTEMITQRCARASDSEAEVSRVE